MTDKALLKAFISLRNGIFFTLNSGNPHSIRELEIILKPLDEVIKKLTSSESKGGKE